MRKLLALALVGLAVLTGCGQDEPTPVTPSHVAAGGTVDLGNSTAFLTLVQACGANAVLWTYSGVATVGAGYSAAIDGQVTQAGVFTAPVCGSTLLGTTVTVTAACDGKPPVSANITVGQELVNSITLVAADVKVCGGAVCRALNPLAITIPACPPTTPSTIQFYARIDTSCGTGAAYSPSVPPTGVPACTF